MGKYQARICGDAIAARAQGKEPAVRDRSSTTCVPQVIFTVPEVAAVGLTEEQARDAGIRTRVVEFDIGNVSGASLFADGYTGKAQMVTDEDRKVIVGMTLAGPGVGEMIHAATIAVAGKVPLDTLWHAVPSYPTISELWLRLLESYGLLRCTRSEWCCTRSGTRPRRSTPCSAGRRARARTCSGSGARSSA
jgi:dihydrolipoamide dehydrogenase